MRVVSFKVFVTIILVSSLFAVSGCSTKIPVYVKPSTQNKGITQETEQLILSSENQDGGFSLLLDQKPIYLYDTYYNIALLKKFGYPILHKQTIQRSLYSYESNPLLLKGTNDLLNVYYETSLNALLGTPIPPAYKNQVKTFVLKSLTKSGLFHLSPKDNLLQMLSYSDVDTSILNNIGTVVPLKYSTALSSTLTLLIKDGSLSSLSPYYIWTLYDSIYRIAESEHLSNFLSSQQWHSILEQANQSGQKVFSSVPDNMEQLINDTALCDLLAKNSLAPTISEQFTNYLVENVDTDGGYNIFSRSISDPQFTLQISENFHPEKNNLYLNKFVSNIDDSQLPNGMFTTRYVGPSDLVNSYLALEILIQGQVKIPQSLKNYFMNINTSKLSPVDLYYLNQARESLDIPTIVPPKLPDHWDANTTNRDVLFEIMNNVTYKSTTQQQKREIILYLNKLQHPNGGFGIGSESAEDSYFISGLYELLNTPVPNLTKFKSWIQRNCIINNQTNLTNIYYLLQLLHTYRIPYNATNIKKFIHQCSIRTGGFEVNPQEQGMVSIQSTFDGVGSLELIDG